MEDNKDRATREAELKVRAVETLIKSEEIKIEIDHHYLNICKFLQNYPESKVDQMDWVEKEKVLAEVDIMFNKLRSCETRLKVIDEEYEVLREEVNAFYGREVMKRVLPPDFFDKYSFDDEPPDPADYWKK